MAAITLDQKANMVNDTIFQKRCEMAIKKVAGDYLAKTALEMPTSETANYKRLKLSREISDGRSVLATYNIASAYATNFTKQDDQLDEFGFIKDNDLTNGDFAKKIFDILAGVNEQDKA